MEDEKTEKHIYITDFDLERLRNLMGDAKSKAGRDSRHLQELERELDRATVVDSREVPPNVITMNSKVALVDVDTGEKMTLTLAFPSDASMENGRISVLAPIGTAMIGYRKGDVIEWEVPAGPRRLEVRELLYPPESAGYYHLSLPCRRSGAPLRR